MRKSIGTVIAVVSCSVIALVGTPAGADPDWHLAMEASSPAPRVNHAIAYDGARGRTVLFGGHSFARPLDDTWTWDGNSWVEAAPGTRPPGRIYHAMAYDSARGRVVLFGGSDVYGGNLGDTWEWDGSNWVELTPGTSPPARHDHAMAYDSARGRVVLFGGGYSDTWEWDGSTWVQATPETSPSARSRHAMAYDSARGRVVLFGGAGGGELDDTWEWDGSDWVQLTPGTSPPARYGHAMAYDSARGRVVLFGGWDGDVEFGDTWEWDGSNWVQATPGTSPPARFYFAMAYDSARGRVVLFGGQSDTLYGDAWEWDGSTWVEVTPGTSPSARIICTMTYDSARDRVVLFGGFTAVYWDDTWEWDGSTWVEATTGTGPPARAFHAMAYDSARGRVVLFGGEGDSGYLRDTWEWDGSTWVEVTPTQNPAARAFHALAYDSARGRVVLFGGEGNSGTLDDTWEWDGSTWIEATPGTSPAARAYHALAYDSARGRVVLFGGYDTTYYGDTWEWDGSAWVQATPAGTSPSARVNHAMAYDSARGRVVLFGGYDTTYYGDTWEWDGGTWVETTPGTGPSARDYHAMAYDSARGRVVLFGGYDTTYYGDTWEYESLDVDSDSDGYSPADGDCDDTNPDVHPGAPEFCDGLDNDCDGAVDEGCTLDHLADADFTWTPPAPAAGDLVTFLDLSTGESLSWSWDLDGDGQAESMSQNPAWTYTQPGPYPVTLVVSNAYGEDRKTGIVFIASSASEPLVTGVVREYGGWFLDGMFVYNLFDVAVDWEGDPGTVAFSVNDGPSVVEPGTTSGAQHYFHIGMDFPSNWWPSTVGITPTNGDGIPGPSWTESVYKFPFPLWLVDALDFGGHISFETTPGEVRADVRWAFPDPPFSGKVTIPDWVPYLSGEFGVSNTQASVDGSVSSNGSGHVTVAGMTGFEALGGSFSGDVSGSGDFLLAPPRGLVLTTASFNLGLEGTISKNVGVVEAIPQLASATSWPVVGSVIDWFNDRATLKGQISPDLDLAASFAQDDGGDLRFRAGSGQLGVDMGGTLEIEALPKRFTVVGWVSGGGSMSVGLPEPLLRAMEVHVEAGVEFELDYFFGVSSGAFSRRAVCSWSTGEEILCRTDDGAEFEGESVAGSISVLRRDYEKFGAYNALAAGSPSSALSADETGLYAETLVSNVFLGASPTVREVGAGKLLLWEVQDLADPVLQSTDIWWSFNGGGGWSAPAGIVDDTRAELSPVLGLDNSGHGVAVWLRIADPAFSGLISEPADLPLFYKQLEVVTATFDPVTATWSSIEQLTNDTAFDGDTRVAASDGELLLTWLSNPDGEFLSTQASPSALMFSVWDDVLQSWEAPAVVAPSLVGVCSHASAFNGTEAVVLVSRELDPEDIGQAVLDRYAWDGATWTGPIEFAGGGADNRLPTVVYDAVGEAHVAWVRGGDLVAATLSDPTPVVVRAGSSSMAFYGARLHTNSAGNLLLVWQEVVDNGPAQVFVRIYDPASGQWSEDRRLTFETDHKHHSLDGFYGADGHFYASYLDTEIVRIEATLPVGGEDYTFTNIPDDGVTNLELLDHSLIVDLAVADQDLEVAPLWPESGDWVTASLYVRNGGDFSVGVFDVELYVGDPETDGVLVGMQTIVGPLPAASSTEVTFEFTLPEQLGNVVAVVDSADEVTELDETNNRARYYLVNQAPVAAPLATPTAGSAPLTVHFDVGTSYDPDGDAVVYRWSFGDGTPDGSGGAVDHTFQSIGYYPVTLTVSDTRGAVGTSTVLITVGPLPPPPPAVPDGGARGGSALTVSKSGSSIGVTWDVATCSTALDYVVFSGELGDFSTVTWASCSGGSAGSATIELPGDSRWFVVTGTNGLAVGSFGLDSQLRERMLSGWADLCEAPEQDTSAPCP